LEKAGRYADRLTMIETMAAGLAHEIKNPLGGIKGSAQLLELELEDNSELQEYTQLIVRESERVNRIIEELLNLSRPRKTKAERLNIGLLLDEVIKLQSKTALDQEIRFKLQLDPSIPDIPGDRDLLVRLFLNLVKNSCEATPNNSTITVTTRIDSEYQLKFAGSRPTPMVEISISDQGGGISTAELEKAFTPFYTTKPSGNGLGLPICQKIVTDHEGQLHFSTLPEGGTQVKVSLPLFDPHSTDATNKRKKR
ncbi:MAG: PAS domain-containing sensor histidine kinase, partial [Desulfuromonadales bacterium]|nr:PAS domain-containing sensor histidine kinase [Desulfuromonadales bacterium]